MLAQAPGIDSRVWIATARVDDDDNAIRFAVAGSDDGAQGWLVDVTIQGGPLDQDGPITCKVSASFGANEQGRLEPVTRDALVLISIPCGNTNTAPTIIGYAPCDDCAPPPNVNGTDIDEAYALANHILVTPHGVDEQVGGDRRIKTDGTHRILGPNVELADEGATQAYVKGNDQQQALDTWYTAFIAWIELVRLGIVAGGGTLDNSTITTATNQLKADLTEALSQRITGE